MSNEESVDFASEIATTINEFKSEETPAETENAQTQEQESQPQPTQSNSFLEALQDYKDYLENIRNQYGLDEISFIKDLIRVQQIYEQNPKAFTVALIQKHLPEIVEKLTKTSEQTSTQQPSQETTNFDDLDEEDRKLYETLNQIQQKLAQFDQFQQFYQQQILEQQTQTYLNELQKLSEELPLLRNASLAPKIAQLTEQLLASGLERDFAQAVRRAYKALAPETQTPVAKPLKNVGDTKDLIDIKDDEPMNETIKKIFNAFKGYQSF